MQKSPTWIFQQCNVQGFVMPEQCQCQAPGSHIDENILCKWLAILLPGHVFIEDDMVGSLSLCHVLCTSLSYSCPMGRQDSDCPAAKILVTGGKK